MRNGKGMEGGGKERENGRGMKFKGDLGMANGEGNGKV